MQGWGWAELPLHVQPGALSPSDAHCSLPLQRAEVAAPAVTEKVRIAVLGASGYTGEEVVRILSLHPSFKVTVLTGDRQAGKVG